MRAGSTEWHSLSSAINKLYDALGDLDIVDEKLGDDLIKFIEKIEEVMLTAD